MLDLNFTELTGLIVTLVPLYLAALAGLKVYLGVACGYGIASLAAME